MKKTRFSVLVFVIGFLFVSASFAQQRVTRTNSGAPGPGNLYDPATVARVKGEVLSVEEFTPTPGMPPGVEFILKTDGAEVVRVFVGPKWYLANEDFEIKPKDMLEVKGSKITYEGKPAMVASVVLLDDEVVKLRDDNGAPVWSAWAPRQ